MTDDPPRGRRPSGGAPPPSPARGLRLGRVGGVPIYLSPIALLFAALIASLFAQLDRDRLPELTNGQVYALAVATAVGLLASLVLHELGHCLAALGFGLGVRSVTVYGFAGFTEIEPEPQTPTREFLVAVAGPAVNGVLAAGCWIGYELTVTDSRPAVLLFDLAVTNLGLFVFNLAPGLPLDGGRLVVSGVWAATRDKIKATRVGAYAGFAVAAALALWGVQIAASGGSGIWTLAVAAFLALGAQQSLRRAQVRERVPGLSAGRLARRTLPVDGSLPLAEALRRAMEVGTTAIVVVDSAGTPTMVMNGAAVDALPDARRPWVPVSSVSRPLENGMVLDADLEGEDLITALSAMPASEYVVFQNGRPVGVLATVDVIARIDPAVAARMLPSRR